MSEEELHQLYLAYVYEWEIHHADPVFAGMVPASYEEWLDNEGRDLANGV